jgi:SsrA-binding protein
MADIKNKYKLITKNKKAYFDYEIIDSWEAWIELKWHEVKSIRSGHVNLKWSYISCINQELFAKSIHISAWKTLANRDSLDTKRDRKIFLHKKTVIYLYQKLKEAWFSIVPLEVYFKWSLIKIKVALVKWKKKYQKKQILKERDMDKQAKIMMKKFV